MKLREHFTASACRWRWNVRRQTTTSRKADNSMRTRFRVILSFPSLPFAFQTSVRLGDYSCSPPENQFTSSIEKNTNPMRAKSWPEKNEFEKRECIRRYTIHSDSDSDSEAPEGSIPGDSEASCKDVTANWYQILALVKLTGLFSRLCSVFQSYLS